MLATIGVQPSEVSNIVDLAKSSLARNDTVVKEGEQSESKANHEEAAGSFVPSLSNDSPCFVLT